MRDVTKETSTKYERRSLGRVINLSDGHTRQPLTPTQVEIVKQLPGLFEDASRRSQFDLEEEFINAFFQLSRQPVLYSYDKYLLSYSASTAIEMLASYCRRTSKTVALIEPCFDNIPNILKREGVSLVPLPEEHLNSNELPSYLERLSADAIWIVCPNNPTGSFMGQEDFESLVRFCSQHNKMLICDFCFRFFCREMLSWDQYGILKNSNVCFAAIEDTGKTWATLDMKLGIMVCSDDTYPEMYQMHDDLLLNVSPFHLRILSEFARDTYVNGLENTILHYVDYNRNTLRKTFAGSVLEPVTPDGWAVTMEWIKINAAFTGEDLWKALLEAGIHILPGSNFYWQDPSKGQKYIRIPLTRDQDMIAESASVIRQIATALANNGNELIRFNRGSVCGESSISSHSGTLAH